MNENIYYIDISKIGKDFTGKKDVALLTNERAVSESIKNLIGTKPGQRIMNPEFGINVEQFLFQPIDDLSALEIRQEIEYGLEQFEPRLETFKVEVIPVEDENMYIVNLSFTIKVLKTTQEIQITLNKVI